MTEDEAKKHICPMSFGSHSGAQPCIGAKCMAWRQAKKPNPDWKNDRGYSYPAPDTRFDPPMFIPDPDHGYCGLAGNP